MIEKIIMADIIFVAVVIYLRYRSAKKNEKNIKKSNIERPELINVVEVEKKYE